MAKVTFTIEGPPGAVPLHAFLAVFHNQLLILNNLDAALSRQPKGLLDWYVTDLKLGSLEASLQSGFRDDEEPAPPNHARKVGQAYRDGFQVIEGEGFTPAYFDDRDLLAARQTFRMIGRDGISGYRVRLDDPQPPIRLTAQAAVNVEQLIKPGERTIGSVEGRLTEISIAGRSPRFTVFDQVTKKGVGCHFKSAMLDAVKDALGKRVFAHGDLTYNRRGEPKKIVLDTFSVVQGHLPTPADVLRTMGDNLTGDLTTRQYLEMLRGD